MKISIRHNRENLNEFSIYVDDRLFNTVSICDDMPSWRHSIAYKAYISELPADVRLCDQISIEGEGFYTVLELINLI